MRGALDMQKGFTIWFTGLSGAGKTTLSGLVHHQLQKSGVTNVEVLDGDVVRTHLSKGLGFSKEDRDTNIRRIGWVAHLLAKNNVPNLVSAISPYRTVREEVREMIEKTAGPSTFVEVFVDCPVEVCEKRDVKGLYARVRAAAQAGSAHKDQRSLRAAGRRDDYGAFEIKGVHRVAQDSWNTSQLS